MCLAADAPGERSALSWKEGDRGREATRSTDAGQVTRDLAIDVAPALHGVKHFLRPARPPQNGLTIAITTITASSTVGTSFASR